MPHLPDLPVTTTDRETYRSIAAGGAPPADQDVHRLLDLGLITADPYQPARYIAHDPRAVAQRVLADTQATIAQALQCMAELPVIEGLASDFDPHRWYGGPASEWLPTRDEMNARIGEALRDASSEMLTAQPGAPVDRDPAVQQLGMDRVLDLVDRGLSVKSIYTAAVQEHAQTRAHLAAITEAGAEVSTLQETFPRMVLIDRTHLFIDNHVMAAERDSGWHVFDRAGVAWAHAIYQQLWARADRWQNGQAPDGVLTERQKMILRVLDEGEPQQRIAPRLSLSERTVTKEIAAARAAVGAKTVYQLMSWWGRQAAE
ncbi:LuxR C-terminal-related transcriptional regulator [Streptomyces brevispora]|uniref:LuxR C-terminal-related transcriptional regulator n=1 Tax=Streptomyces brevispora TaxID=887462 RepID=UPI002E36DFD9|nr:LuxR C-terminal-related transcriptional regulator [Streptomyces brevispora]